MRTLSALVVSVACFSAHGEWIVILPAEVAGRLSWTTQYAERWCRGLKFRKESNQCIAHGDPSNGGLPFVTFTEEPTKKFLSGYMGYQPFVEKSRPFRPEIQEVHEAADTKLDQFPRPELPGASKKYWGLDRIDQRMVKGDGKYKPDGDGKGVHVYVVDTGIRVGHEDFGGRAVPELQMVDGVVELCYKKNQSCADDKNEHGTHVAGTVGGTQSGVAKGVMLHAVKVLEQRVGYTHNLLPAIDAILVRAMRPAIMQMSLGADGKSDALDYALRLALKKNIISVVAAGNKDLDACKQTPAHVKSAVVVGATTNQDRRAFYSNYGSCVDIYAPGHQILSANGKTGTGFQMMSGTSMAAPHVSGALAVLWQKEGLEVGAEDIVEKLTKRATKDELKDAKSNSWNVDKLGPNHLLYVKPCRDCDDDQSPIPQPTPAPAPSPTIAPTSPPDDTSPPADLETRVARLEAEVKKLKDLEDEVKLLKHLLAKLIDGGFGGAPPSRRRSSRRRAPSRRRR